MSGPTRRDALGLAGAVAGFAAAGQLPMLGAREDVPVGLSPIQGYLRQHALSSPLETRNLAAAPAHKTELSRLAERLRGYVRDRAVYARLGEDAPGADRSGETRKERLRKARIWYESIAEGSGLAV